MSRTTAPETISRPTLFDYLLLLGGVSLSLYLMSLAPIGAARTVGASDARLDQIVAFLPTMMRVPEGILLLWPLFYLTQWLSRTQALTAGEWLWLLSWVGVLMLTGLTAWEYLLGLPESLRAHAGKPRLLWYVLVMPAMAVLALILLFVGLFSSRPTPWTHTLALALILWSAPPALLVLTLGTFVLP